MKTKKIVLIVLIIILVSNVLPIHYFTSPEYHYRNRDGSFQFTEFPGKGLDYEVCKIRFERFKAQHPDNKNIILYRNFSLQFWRFWEWRYMLSHWKKYKLPKY